ncbi:MAG: hypothetical protein U5L45_11110 [Saprospiraceae bacterium]|nr:hypothetical protein [Saprospiraceae bacterium]
MFSFCKGDCLVTRSLRPREGGSGWFFGQSPKNEPHSPFLRAKRAMG